MKTPSRRDDWVGWASYFEKRRKEICAEALGITEWSLPRGQHEALCNLFLASLSLKFHGEERFFLYRSTMTQTIGGDAGTAFSLAFDGQLHPERRALYLKLLGEIVGKFEQAHKRPKVKELQILVRLLEFIDSEHWPTNKEIVDASKACNQPVSKATVSDFASDEGIPLAREREV